ncbi:MAG: hypothetical protein SPI30_08700 [Prevotella sp.]|nr:hypothetical protein [Prevotella sp.]
MIKKRRGRAAEKRAADINRIYDYYCRTGLSNREIWRRYIYPAYGICERQLYKILKKEVPARQELEVEGFLFPELLKEDERRNLGYYRKNPE